MIGTDFFQGYIAHQAGLMGVYNTSAKTHANLLRYAGFVMMSSYYTKLPNRTIGVYSPVKIVPKSSYKGGKRSPNQAITGLNYSVLNVCDFSTQTNQLSQSI